MEKLTFREKLFCEAMSLLLSGWWLLIICLLFVLRRYLLVGFFVVVGMAIVIASLEMIRDEISNKEMQRKNVKL